MKQDFFLSKFYFCFCFMDHETSFLLQSVVKKAKNKAVTDILIQVTACISFTITNILQN